MASIEERRKAALERAKQLDGANLDGTETTIAARRAQALAAARQRDTEKKVAAQPPSQPSAQVSVPAVGADLAKGTMQMGMGELLSHRQALTAANKEMSAYNQRQQELAGLEEKYADDSDFMKGVKSIPATAAAAIPMTKDAVVGAVKDLANDGVNTAIRGTEEYQALAKEYSRLQGLKRTLNPKAVNYKARVAEIKKQMAENESARAAMMKRTAIDPNSTGMQKMREANWLRQEATEDLSGAGLFAANTALSIGQNLAVLPTAAINPAIPLVAMGTMAGAQKAYEVTEAGGYAGDALARGIISGGIEAATEKMGIDNLLDLIKTGGKTAVANMLKQAGAEATEEAVSYVVNFAADKAANDPNATWSWAELAESAAAGGVSGLFFGGAGTAANKTIRTVKQYAADNLTGETLVQANRNLDLLESAEGYKEGSETRKLADAIMQDMEHSENALTAVSNAQWGKLYHTMQRELDLAGPQDGQSREAVVQTMHPDEKVMSPTAQAFIDAGDDAATADAKSAIMDRILAGDTSLTDTELRKLDLRAPSTKAAFTALTGMEVPQTTDTKTLLKTYRAAAEEAAKVREGQAALEKAEDAMLEGMRQRAAAMAEQAEAAKSDTPAPEVAAQEPQVVSEYADTVMVEGGQNLNQEQFVSAYLAEHPGADQSAAEAQYLEAVRLNGFGMEYPAFQAQVQKSSVEATARPSVEAGPENSAQMGVDTTQADGAVESPAEAETEVAKKEASRMQKLVAKAATDALKGSGVTGVEVAFEGFGEDENAFHDKTTGRIVLNGNRLTSARAMVAILGHELTHPSANADAKVVQEILDFAEKWLGAENVDAALEEMRTRYIDFYVGQKGMSLEDAMAMVDLAFAQEELAGDLMADVFANTDAMQQLARHNATLLQRARDAAARLVTRLAAGKSSGARAMRTEAEFLVDRMDRALRGTKSRDTMDKNEEVRHSVETTQRDDGRRTESSNDFVDRVTKAGGRVGEVGEIRYGYTPVDALRISRQGKDVRRELTAEEKDALLRYKSGESYQINAKLREQMELNGPEQAFLAHLDAALEKLPTHEGEVIRRISFADFGGQDAYEEFLAEHEEGAFVVYPSYTSASTVEDGYPLDGDLVVEIRMESLTARDVGGYGNNFESEVIFSRSSRHVVLGQRNENGRTIITTKEAIAYAGEYGQLHPEERGEVVQQMQAPHSGNGDLQGLPERHPDRVGHRETAAHGAVSGGQRDTVRAQGKVNTAKEGTPSATGEDAFSVRRSLGALPDFEGGITERKLRRIAQSPEFQAWFHDGNGELVNPKTGLPYVFYHGTGQAGYTRFEAQQYGEPGFWFAKHAETSDSEYYTGREPGGPATREFRPQAPKSWKKMVEYIESEYPHLTIELDDYTGMYVVSDAETWENLGAYKPTKASLAKLDRDLQELSRTGEPGLRGMPNPGIYQVFLSMKNPLVVECGGVSWSEIDVRALDGTDLRGKVGTKGNGKTTTNMVVSAAQKAGYDGVIFKNVLDGRMGNGQDVAATELPAEVQAILDAHNNFGAPNADAALDTFADLGFLPGLSGDEEAILSDYVSEKLEVGEMDRAGLPVPDDDFVVFDSAQIKSVHNTGTFDAGNPDIRFSVSGPYREPGPVFFSKMEQEIAAFKQAKMGATSVVSYLKGHGVKDEEIKWSGIQQFLEGKKSITREELQEFIRMNTLELEEQTLDGHRELKHYQDNETGEIFFTLEDMETEAYRRAAERGIPEEDVKFDQYTFDSGCFYVSDSDSKIEWGEDIILDFGVEFSEKEPQWEEYKTPGGENYRELLYKMPKSEYSNRAMKVHWGEAGEGEGVLAHARVQDFKTEDGEMLFIEEIQSDWHNAGQKSGYQTEDVTALVKELKELREKRVWNDPNEAEQKREAELEAKLYPKRAELDKRRDELKSRLSEGGVLASVVDKLAEVKFDGNRHYAENNVLTGRSATMFIDDYSAAGVQFTDAERDALRAFFHDKGLWQEDNTAYISNGGREGELSSKAPDAPYAKNYHEYVLKRLLRMAAEYGYDSIGWTTGKMQEERWSSEYAEGYRIEYDQDIPKFLNKYGKQWGAKVEKTRLDTGEEGRYDRRNREAEQLRMDMAGWQRELANAETESQREFCQAQIDYTREELRRMMDVMQGPEIWTMKLTDKMREDVLYKGQPRYSVSKSQPFSEQVHRALTEELKENRYNALYIRETPNILAEVGLGDLPMCMTASHAKDINHPKGHNYHWHGIPEGLIARLPNLLDKPAMILDSDTQKGDVVVVTSAVDTDGAPVLVSIRPNGGANVDGVESPANFITSMYGKDRDFAGWVESNAKNSKVLYWNKNRTQKLFRLARLQLPAALTALGSDTILRQHGGYVKENIPARKSSVSKKGNAKTGGNTGNINPETGYESGSVADSFMRILNTGDRKGALDMLERAAQQLAQAEAERAEQRKQQLVQTVLRPKLSEDAITRNKRIVDELIAKYGEMEQTNAAQREVHIPKQIDPETKVRGFMQTAMAAQATTEDVSDALTQDILSGTAGTTYTPVTDNAALREVQEAVKDKREFAKARAAWSSLVDSGQMPTKQDIAKAEALYVQACAEGQVFEAQKLAAEIAVMGTQAGQVVQAMTLVKRMTPAGQLYYIQKTVDRLNADKAQKDRNVTLKIDPKLAKQLLEAKNKAERDAALDAITQSLADQMPVTIYDKWNTWRYLAMLGNPRTHIRNLLGNAVFTPARLIKDTAAMGLEHMVIKDQNQRTKGFADKALRDFARQDAELMEDELRGGGKYDPKDLIRDKRRIFKTGVLNWAEKFNSSMLEKEDWWFLRGAYTRALSGFLAARGFTAEQVSGPNSTKAGRAALDQGRIYAIQEAQKATYRDASKVAQWINHTARNSGPVGSVLVGGLMPFTKTPVNIVKRGLEYSPVGVLTTGVKGAWQLRSGEMTAAEFIDSMAAGLTGTAIVALGYFLARAGLLVGGLGDEDEDKFQELQGNQEYSLRVGDQSFTIDWAAPTVLPLFVGEAIHKFSENEGVDGWEVLEAAAGLLDPVMSLSMLDGLNNTLSAVKYDTGEPIPAILQTIFGSYVSQGVPTVLGAVARTVDESRRTSFTPKGQTSVERWLSRLWQTSFVGKTPIASEGRMAYVDEWGRVDTENSVLVRAIENFVSPGYINPLKETPLEGELSRLAEATGDNGVYPNKAQKYFSADKKEYVMNQEEYQEHLLYRGQKSYKLAGDITTSRTYAGLDDKTRAKAVELAYDYAAAMAKVNTTDTYAPDKWMVKLAELERNGGDAAEYLMLRAQSKVNGLSLTEQVLQTDTMTAVDAAEILVMERTMPSSFTDPYIKGYEYQMDDAQQDRYAQAYREKFVEAYLELSADEDFQKASLAERKELVSDLGTEVNSEVKYDMADWMDEHGFESAEKE